MPTYVYWIRFLYQVLSDGWLSMERPESVSTQSGCFKRGAKTIINDLPVGLPNHMWPQSTTEFTVTWVAMANIYSNSDPDFE